MSRDREGLVVRISGVVLMLSVALLFPTDLVGQDGGPRTVRIDAEVFYATISVVWDKSSAWAIGPELGLGILEQKTFAPSTEDFVSIAHAGVVFVRDPGPGPTIELGLRAGIGELRRCFGDCLPDGYFAVAGGLSVGGDRWRVGTRLTIGRLSGDSMVAWSPVFLRVRL
jgi:hypothetical protein